MKKNIVLIGMPGSGKSTIGVLLAKALGWGFTDTDLVLMQHENRKLQDMLDNEGLEFFLKAEEKAVKSLHTREEVIATGGSVVLEEGAMDWLKSLGRIVFIDVPLVELDCRLTNIKSRGIAFEKGQNLQSMYAQRLPLYRKYADYTLQIDSGDLENTVERMLTLIYDEGLVIK